MSSMKYAKQFAQSVTPGSIACVRVGNFAAFDGFDAVLVGKICGVEVAKCSATGSRLAIVPWARRLACIKQLIQAGRQVVIVEAIDGDDIMRGVKAEAEMVRFERESSN